MSAPAPVEALRVFYHRTESVCVLVGRLVYRSNRAYFEFDAEFRASGIELSPFSFKVEEGLLVARPDVFDGLFGLFDDSLPDGWGRLLLDRHIAQVGGHPELLTPLDRLAWIGDRAIGALSYEPNYELKPPVGLDLHALGAEAQVVLEDGTSAALEQLLGLGGSPQGARPKALVLVSDDGETVVSGSQRREGFEPYLVKFSAKSDPRDVGAIELAYSRMAAEAGVTMPNTRLLAARRDHRGFFAIQRFDRRGKRRVHTHTVSGLLNAPPGLSFMSYEELLKVTHVLTRDARDLKQMFRRAAFNVYAHNRDDHARNFAFMMEADGTWQLAPAYDLTFAHGPGGQHTMTIDGEGRSPGRRHLLALAKGAGIRRGDADVIIDEVRSACRRWNRFGEEVRLSKKARDPIRRVLDAIN